MYSGFPIQTSTLAGQGLVEGVLTKYRLREPIRCHFFTKGLNDTYVVKAGASTYYLRVYRYGWRTKSQIHAELDMLTYLHQHQLPVSRPIQKRDGRYLTRVLAPEGTRYACLFTNAEGSQVEMNDRHSYTYGGVVGQIHDCLDKRDVDERRFHLDLGHLIDEPLQYLEPFLDHRKKDFEYLKGGGEDLKGRIEALLPKTKPLYGNCHGDHHGGNLCIDKNGQLTLFDFDCSGYGWRAYDVAVFLWSQHLSCGWSKTGKARATRRWHAFLRGYGNTRTLTQPELEATKVFVPIRHIWLLGLQAHGAEDWGRDWFNEEYLDREIEFIRQGITHYKI